MTLPFYEEIINDGEITPDNFRYANFIGYLSPIGERIDYSRPFGLGGHDVNPSTELFREYLYLSEINQKQYNEFYDEKRYLEHERNYTENMRDYLQPEIEYKRTLIAKYGLSDDQYRLLDDDILRFFYNCYSNELFSVGFNGDNTIMTTNEFYEKCFRPIDERRKRLYPRQPDEDDYRYWCHVPSLYNLEDAYRQYKLKRILEIIKDVMVRYLGYHYVARVPRTIYTSNFKIYETFYNYLLNDYTIYQLPKMNYDINQKKYVEQMQNEFLVSDSELRLKQEIQSIKRLVPLNERSKYYR